MFLLRVERFMWRSITEYQTLVATELHPLILQPGILSSLPRNITPEERGLDPVQ